MDKSHRKEKAGKNSKDKAGEKSKENAGEKSRDKAGEKSKDEAGEKSKSKEKPGQGFNLGETSKSQTKDKAIEKTKPKEKSGEELDSGSESGMADDDRPPEVLDDQLWAEMQFTQAQHGSAIRAIQSQMDAMTLGMAACGSLLKNAKEKVQYHSSIRTGFDETAAETSTMLARSIEMITAGREQLERLRPGVPHRMLEDHIKSLNLLVELGVEFSQVFKTVAGDAHRATVALGEWLQGSGEGETAGDGEIAGDVDMAGVEDEDDSGSESGAGGMAQSDQGSGEEEIEISEQE